jgi:hypothetical protein
MASETAVEPVAEDPFAGAGPNEVVGVNVLVPGAWYEFDTHPETMNRSIRDAVAERVKENPALAEYQSEMVRTLKKAARRVRAANAVYFGSMCEMVDGDPMVASLMVSVSRAVNETTGQVARTGIDTLLGVLNPVEPGRRPTDPWRRVRVLDLPGAGRAVRTEGIEDVDVPEDNRSYRAVMSQTFVPFPGDSAQVAVISASTPQLGLVEPMLELFDAIAETFRFVRRADLETADLETADLETEG